MFTLKLMRGVNNEQIDIISASRVRIDRRKLSDSPEVAIIVDEGSSTEFWYYLTSTPGDDFYRMCVVENLAGKTTEVVHS